MKQLSKLIIILLFVAIISTNFYTIATALGTTLPGETIRVSVKTDGTEGNEYSWKPKISYSGQYIAFESEATTFVDNDDNGFCDIFVYEGETGIISLVSVNSIGEQGNNHSENPAISGNGRYVAFVSKSTNLAGVVIGDYYQIFVHDRLTGTTTLVSKDSEGIPANAISNYPSISSDGNLIVFYSSATNLISGGTNGKKQVFVHNMETEETNLVSITSTGIQGDHDSENPIISADGRYVAFTSYASNLVSDDTNGSDDIFVHDLQTGITTRISVASNGAQGNDRSFGTPSISSDGRFIAFQSAAYNLVDYDTNSSFDIFVHDRNSGETSRVSKNSLGVEAIDNCLNPSISDDGRFVTYNSFSWNLVSGDTNSANDVFVHDRQTSTTELASINSEEIVGNGPSVNPAISSDGYFIAFQSTSTNFDEGDENGFIDVFLHDNREYAEITSENHASFVSGNEESFIITTNGFPIPSINFIGILPLGIQLIDNGDGTGIISGIPDKCTGGQYIFEIQADNGILPIANQTFTLTVERESFCVFIPILTK